MASVSPWGEFEKGSTEERRLIDETFNGWIEPEEDESCGGVITLDGPSLGEFLLLLVASLIGAIGRLGRLRLR